jgi:hypothetical protein
MRACLRFTKAAAVTGMHTLRVEHIVSAFDANDPPWRNEYLIVQLRACVARHRERLMIKAFVPSP